VTGICERFAKVMYYYGIKFTRLPLEMELSSCNWLTAAQQSFYSSVVNDCQDASKTFLRYNLRYFVTCSCCFSGTGGVAQCHNCWKKTVWGQHTGPGRLNWMDLTKRVWRSSIHPSIRTSPGSQSLSSQRLITELATDLVIFTVSRFQLRKQFCVDHNHGRCWNLTVCTGWSKKNGATLHFPKYLENYWR